MPISKSDGPLHCRHCGVLLGFGLPIARAFEDPYCAHMKVPSLREGRDQLCTYLRGVDPDYFLFRRLAKAHGMAKPSMVLMVNARGS
jgi:hypothetical protein